jgi:hypothetical protein
MSAPEEITVPEWFVQKLRQAVADKKAEGATPTMIAFHCGVSVAMLYDYLKGKSLPSVDRWLQMCDYFGWPLPFGPEEGVIIAHSPWNAQTGSDQREHSAV